MTDDPVGDPALDGFLCGSSEYDRSVEFLMQRLYLGESRFEPTVLVAEDTSRPEPATVGVCAWRPSELVHIPDEHLPEVATGLDGVAPGEDVYIHVIGVSQEYRGQKIGDVGIGSALLAEALRSIAGDGYAHRVWAHVAYRNAKSHYLFNRHGFARWHPPRVKRFRHLPRFVLPKRAPGDVTRYRPRALPPPPR
ncbi:MAG TPA: GNAT family N-acetyltransferase [Solirubrobacteraceae bacterium]